MADVPAPAGKEILKIVSWPAIQLLAHLLIGYLLPAAMLTALAAPASSALPPQGSFTDLAAEVMPAVVAISSKHKIAGTPEPPFDFPRDPPFEEFFRHFRDRQSGPRPTAALRSGFIIDPAGYIVTTNRVIEDAIDIEVTLTTGKEYPAKLVAADRKTDLALLKITAGMPLPAVRFGDSDKVRVGDWVMAVGNPFGLGGAVTVGIVSARGRDINVDTLVSYLQIDVTINRGDSGGPTFSLDGEVIGINTAIESPGGGGSVGIGIGFAIPSNDAKRVIQALREHGRVERGWLGVQIQEVTSDIAQAMRLSKAAGALISDVHADSPAAKADLRRGDVILEFEGKRIDRLGDLQRLVAASPVGHRASLTVWRDGAEQAMTVLIGKLEEDQVVPDDHMGSNSNGQLIEALGLMVATITPDVRERFGISEDVVGVVIVDVDSDGPAAEQGLQPGDVIEQVSQRGVTSPAQVKSITETARADHRDVVLLLVNREGEDMYVALKIA